MTFFEICLDEISYNAPYLQVCPEKKSAQIPAKSKKVIPRPEEKKDIFTDTPIFDD